MAKKKSAHIGEKKKSQSVRTNAKPADVRVASELSEAEQDLVSHMGQGWRLETEFLRWESGPA